MAIIPSNISVYLVPSYGPIASRIRSYCKVSSKLHESDYVMTDINGWSFFFLYILAKLFRKKIVLRYRGDVIRELKSRGSYIQAYIQMAILRNVYKIVTVSSYLKGTLHTIGVSPDHVEVVNTPLIVDSRHEYDTDTYCADKILLFVTNFYFKDKVSNLANYLAQIKQYLIDNNLNYKVLIVGDGPYLNEISSNFEYDDNIIFCNALPHDKVMSLFSRAEVFFHFSNLDAYPTVIQEAMSWGIPVIASNCCGIPEMVGHGENGFLLDDPDQLSTYLSLIFNDKQIYKKISINNFNKSQIWKPEYLVREMSTVLNNLRLY